MFELNSDTKQSSSPWDKLSKRLFLETYLNNLRSSQEEEVTLRMKDSAQVKTLNPDLKDAFLHTFKFWILEHV